MSEKKEDLIAGAGGVHEDGGRGRSRRKGSLQNAEKKKTCLPAIITAAVILAAGGAAGYYVSVAHTYQEAFLPNTHINGIDASKKTVEEVKALIEEGLSGYELKVLERTGAGEIITKAEIGLRSEFDGSLEELLAAQDSLNWVSALGTSAEYEISTMIVYDEEKLTERIRNLSCMNESLMEAPEDARLSDYISETKSYEIIPATEGTTLVAENVENAITHAVMNLQAEVDLDAEGCYTRPSVESDDEELQALEAQLNTYVGAVVNHTFGNEREVLNGDTIHTWLSVNGNQVTLDETKVSSYVRELAKKYNTAYSSRKFKTSYGKTVTISGGPYGWRMNESREASEIVEIIKAGEQQTREPEYLQKAASHGEYDYGNTYVEINLSAQHLYFYKDGKLIVDTDFVSGNESRGWGTPAGSYPLTYKQRNATLKGEDYETPVSYWMPFNGNIGLHDASWRNSFGGTIYKTSGSHGCVNLPPGAAKLIYENISAGDPILCYYLTETATTKTSKPTETTAAETAAATTAATTAAATAAPTTIAPTTTAPETTEAKPIETSAAIITPETPAQTSATVTPETNADGPGGQAVSTEVPASPNGPGAAPDYSGGPGATAGNGDDDN